MPDSSKPSANTRLSRFPRTNWTLVMAVADGSPDEARQALEEICRRYWKPIYVFLRKSGRTQHQAEDLTQGFFQRILKSDALKQARAERGKLRSFLLANLKRHLCAESSHQDALKRGGGVSHVSIDISSDDTTVLEKILIENADPETLYERAWARDLFRTVLNTLATRFAGTDKAALFDLMRDSLTGEETRTYAQLAANAGMTEVALRSLVSRMRKSFRTELEREIAETVESPDQVKDEMRYLASLLRR